MTEQPRRDDAQRTVRRARPTGLLVIAVVIELVVGLVGLGAVSSGGNLGTALRLHLSGGTAQGQTDARSTTPDFSGGLGADPKQRAARSTAVRRLLDRHATALVHRDRKAFLDTIDPQATQFRARQAALFDNLADVPLGEWDYQLNADAEHPADVPELARYNAPVWAPEVVLRYALRGFDPMPTERPQHLTFVHRDGEWYLGGDDDFAKRGYHTWRGLWDFGPVVTRQGAASLVLAHPKHSDRLEGFADAVDQAVPHVTEVWGSDWVRRVVVLIPDSQQEMSQVIGDNLTLAHIAAVATTDYTDARSGVVRGQRVVVNPSNLDRLGEVGRRIVLQHEITHVATRSVTGSASPAWLVEGFADYVGYLGSEVPVTVAAQELRSDIQHGRRPQALPVEADFRGDSPRLSQAYEEAWMACRLLANRIGKDGLVQLYQKVGAETGDSRGAVDRALRSTAGLSYDQFVALWRSSVVSELS